MTYMINVTGHGGDADDLKGVFEDTIRALRTIHGDDPNAMLSGSINGSDGTGASFNLNVADVTDLEAVDTDDSDDSPTVSPDDPSAQPVDHEDNDGDA